MTKFFKSDDGLYEKPKCVAESFNSNLCLTLTVVVYRKEYSQIFTDN